MNWIGTLGRVLIATSVLLMLWELVSYRLDLQKKFGFQLLLVLLGIFLSIYANRPRLSISLSQE